jgi:DNA-binding Lrp family transcriptional regulator
LVGVGDPGRLDVIKALQSELNVRILMLLSRRPSYPRELSRLLERDETDVARRLRRLERIGLVRGVWRRVSGKNVRVYELAVGDLKLSFREGRLEVGFGDVGLVKKVEVEGMTIPSPTRLYGREGEKRSLEHSRAPVIHIWGAPGIGKTGLAAWYASQWRGPGRVYWHYSSPTDTPSLIAWRISLLLDSDPSNLSDPASAATALTREGVLVVVDDYHLLPEETARYIASLARRVEAPARLLIASRGRDPRLPHYTGRIQLLELGPLDRKASLEMARGVAASLGVKPSDAELGLLAEESHGIPVVIRGSLELHASTGVPLGEALERISAAYYGSTILEPLGASERELLGLLAVASGGLPLGVACKALGLTRAACGRILRGLERQALIQVEGGHVRLREYMMKAALKVVEGLEDHYSSWLASVLGREPEYSFKVRALEVLARYCRVAEAASIAEARLLEGSSWFTCCATRYMAALDSLAACRIESLYHASLINFERALIRYLNLEPDLEKAAATLSRHLPPLRARRPLYARAALLLATVYYKLGRTGEGDALLAEAVEYMKGLKASVRRLVEATLESTRTLSRLMRGDTLGALESAKREAELELESGDITNYAIAVVHVAVLQYIAGLWGELAESIKRAREAAGLVGGEQAHIILDRLLTVEVPFLLVQGRTREARERLAQTLSRGQPTLEEGHLLEEALVLLAEGAREESSRKAREFLEEARDPLPGERVVATLIAGAHVKPEELEKLPPGPRALADAVLNYLESRDMKKR